MQEVQLINSLLSGKYYIRKLKSTKSFKYYVPTLISITNSTTSESEIKIINIIHMDVKNNENHKISVYTPMQLLCKPLYKR